MFRCNQLSSSLMMVIGVCVFSQGAARATGVTGTTNGSGTVWVSATSIDFDTQTPATTTCGTGPSLGVAGCFTVTSPTSGSFPAIGTIATIKDLTTPAYPGAGAVGAVGVGQVTVGTVNFDLTYIVPGTQPDCASLGAAGRQASNAVCTFFLGVSSPGPFTLVNNGAGGASISMNWLGIAYITDSGSGSTPYAAGFSTQLVGQNIDQIYNMIATPGGSIESSYSVTFAAIPEPATMALTGGALMLLGILRSRKRRQ
jgi:hypothetical protein